MQATNTLISPLILLKQKKMDDDKRSDLQDQQTTANLSKLEERPQEQPNFPLRDTAESGPNLLDKVAQHIHHSNHGNQSLTTTLNKYIMAGKMITKSPYVNDQIKRNISNIQKVQ